MTKKTEPEKTDVDASAALLGLLVLSLVSVPLLIISYVLRVVSTVILFFAVVPRWLSERVLDILKWIADTLPAAIAPDDVKRRNENNVRAAAKRHAKSK